VKPTILYDDREKKPWKFNGFKYPVKLVRKRMVSGDYSVKGFETVLAVERKSGIAELAVNISKQDRARFIKCLQRLSRMQIKYLLIEDCISSIPAAIKALPVRARVTDIAIHYWLLKIACGYKIPVIWLGKSPGMQQKVLNAFWEHVLEVDLKGKVK